MISAAEAGIGEVQAFDVAADRVKWEEGLKAIAEATADNTDNNNVSILRQWLRINNPDSI